MGRPISSGIPSFASAGTGTATGDVISRVCVKRGMLIALIEV